MTEQTKVKSSYSGICKFCRGEFDKAKMTQHLKNCKERARMEAEAAKSPEHPAITIEGNPAFKHKLEKDHYSLRLAYHPDPKNTGEALFYNIVASGEKAQEFYGLYITDTRMQLHVTGDLVAGEKGRTAGTIRAESIEVIHGRKARSDIQHEKVKLANTQ